MTGLRGPISSPGNDSFIRLHVSNSSHRTEEPLKYSSVTYRGPVLRTRPTPSFLSSTMLHNGDARGPIFRSCNRITVMRTLRQKWSQTSALFSPEGCLNIIWLSPLVRPDRLSVTYLSRGKMRKRLIRVKKNVEWSASRAFICSHRYLLQPDRGKKSEEGNRRRDSHPRDADLLLVHSRTLSQSQSTTDVCESASVCSPLWSFLLSCFHLFLFPCIYFGASWFIRAVGANSSKVTGSSPVYLHGTRLEGLQKRFCFLFSSRLLTKKINSGALPLSTALEQGTGTPHPHPECRECLSRST